MGGHFAASITMHDVRHVLQNAMTAQFAASARNFVMTETNIGVGKVHEEFIKEKLIVKDGMLKVPEGPGIGVTPIEAAIKENRMRGEPWWD